MRRVTFVIAVLTLIVLGIMPPVHVRRRNRDSPLRRACRHSPAGMAVMFTEIRCVMRVILALAVTALRAHRRG